MYPRLAEALNLLGFASREDGIEPMQYAEAFFDYLYLAGYLSPTLISDAVDFLHAAHPFSADPEDIKNSLNRDIQSAMVVSDANAEPIFSAAQCLQTFGSQATLTAGDLIEILIFLQQTAFDREFGQERDRLQAHPWMAQHVVPFIGHARTLGVIEGAHVPSEAQLLGVGIMGAASTRVKTRIDYFNALGLPETVPVWALSGQRELSKGLDTEEAMKATAKFIGLEEEHIKFVEKPVGVDKRIFLDGVTETQMVNYFLNALCPQRQISVIHSAVQEAHWRATTCQNAADIAPVVIQKMQGMIREGLMAEGAIGTFMIIAEQPHSKRMAMEVQRAIDAAIKKQGLALKIRVQGCGAGLNVQAIFEDPSKQLPILSGVNSALATLMSVKYKNARDQVPDLFKRDEKIVMYSSRKARYNELRQTPSAPTPGKQ